MAMLAQVKQDVNTIKSDLTKLKDDVQSEEQMILDDKTTAT